MYRNIYTYAEYIILFRYKNRSVYEYIYTYILFYIYRREDGVTVATFNQLQHCPSPDNDGVPPKANN